MADDRVQIGTSFPTETFSDEIQGARDVSDLATATLKEFRLLYSLIEGFLRAAGFNSDGTFNTIVANQVTVVNNYDQTIPSPTPGIVTIVNADGSTTECCGGGGGGGGDGCPVCPAIVPYGSLLFSGFGDAPVKWTTPDGVILTTPGLETAQLGTGDCGGLVQLPTGEIGASRVTVGSDTFETFNPQTLAPVAGQALTIWSLAATTTKFFASGFDGSVPNNNLVYELSAAGALLTTYDLGVSNFPTALAIGISPDGLIAYIGRRNVAAAVVAYTLAGGNASFATEATYSVRDNTILVLPNGNVLIGWHKAGAAGFVRLYDTAGATISTYTLPSSGTTASPVCLALGTAPGSSFWCSFYSDATTFSGIRVVEIDVATGTILHCFDPEDGTFEFDGPFCRVTEAISG